MYKIFIIEDEPAIAEAVKKHLEAWGFEVRCASDFKKVMEEFDAFSPQLVLLDIGLPFHNGFYWCGEIRKNSRVPVVFLSSASDNMDIVLAMNMGGDDFIAKPFDLSVLMAKINAVLRRCYDFSGNYGIMEHRGAALDLTEACMTYRGEKIELTKNEFRILEILLENKGRTVSREAIMEKLWETDQYVDENALSVNISRLRKKLENNGLEGFISTRQGLGYIVE